MAPGDSRGRAAEPSPTVVRLATAADADAVLEIYRDVVLHTPISFEVEPPAAGEMARRIRETLERFPWLVAVAGAPAASDLLGYAYASPYRSRAAYDWSAEVSVYVAEGARRRGVARSLYEGLHRILERQNIHVVYAGITLPNPASEALHCDMGFETIGLLPNAGYKFGRWHDVLWLRRELMPAGREPAPFLPLPQLDEGAIGSDLR